MIKYADMKYLTGAATYAQCPEDIGIEIAFAGRSNAGKSSALNTLAKQKNLARVSKTPGRTQLINFFKIDNHKRLIDLPGYGYAKVAEHIKVRWQQTMVTYLAKRQSLKAVVVVMDAGHPLKTSDTVMIETAITHNLHIHLLLTKVDKLTNREKNHTQHLVQKYLNRFDQIGLDMLDFQFFSSSNKTGLSTLEQKLNLWYQLENDK
jgi:GTP-binding protein